MLVSPAPTLAGETKSLEAILEESAARYNEVEGFSARFRQKVEIPLLEKEKEFSGMLRYKSPNKLLLDYDSPEGAYILCDGESFYVYLPDVDSTGVMKTRLGKDPRSFLTEFFLAEAREEYAVSLVGEESGAYHLRFVPRGEGAEIMRIDMWIGRATKLVERISSVDPGGSVTSYILDSLMPAPQPEEYFKFTLPRGKRLIDLGAHP
jgi:outer membrane lipoprotein-sorting protein